jgi:hypothetical protein
MTTTIIASILGIISTLVAWFFNPRQSIYREIDAIQRQLEELYVMRDKALLDNNSNALSDISARISGLCDRKKVLLQRLREGIRGCK